MVIDVQWDSRLCATATLRYQVSSNIEGCADTQEEMPGLTSSPYTIRDLQLDSTYIIDLAIISNDPSQASITDSSMITTERKGV